MFRIPFAVACLLCASVQDPHDEQLLKALSKSKLTLREGIQQVSKGTETAISAKFELEDGKLSLSVYTAGKGLTVDAEHNVLQEYSGSPEAAWKPAVEVFKDVEHVARSAQQLTLMALSPASLLDALDKAEKQQTGTVYSITPTLRDRKARFVVLVADQGHRKEVVIDATQAGTSPVRDADAPKK
jgi:hypothetical protein